MNNKISDDRISVMQQNADIGLAMIDSAIVSLAEHTNDLLDEREMVMLPEIVRLTDLLSERDDQILHIANERDDLRREIDRLRSFESDVRSAISKKSQADAPSIRAVLLEMRVGDSRTFSRLNGILGRTFSRTAAGWETDVHSAVLSIDDAVAYIRAHDMIPLT